LFGTEEIKIMSNNIGSGSSGAGSGGAGSKYTGTSTVNEGGINVGDSFTNADSATMWKALLEPFIAPVFSSFALSGFSTIEVGDKIPLGNYNFIWGTTQAGNVAVNSIDIIDVTNGSNIIGTGLANDGVELLPLPEILKTIVTSHQFRIEGTDTNTTPTLFTRNYSVNWRFNRWFGFGVQNSAPTTSANIRALSNKAFLSASNTGSFNIVIPANTQEVYFYVPSGKTATVLFVESSNADVTGSFTQSTVTVNGLDGSPNSYDKYVSFIGVGGFPSVATYAVTIS